MDVREECVAQPFASPIAKTCDRDVFGSAFPLLSLCSLALSLSLSLLDCLAAAQPSQWDTLMAHAGVDPNKLEHSLDIEL